MTYPTLADLDLIETISARLDLREPNREALTSVALATSQHFDVDHEPPPFECVVDSATGVGKTYVMAALIEYFSQIETPARNFLLLAPGRTIRDKSIANFTPGHRKSLTGSMVSRPYVVTSENFKTPATVAALRDTSLTKLFIFTVQALTSKTGDGRSTHEFQETLGGSLYGWLKDLEDLVILADESHCYRSPAFSKTIKELVPEVVIGMTATPLPSEVDQIVYRYPLARAIADEYVKTPVLVARKDERKDTHTKLLDGVTLLKCKAEVAGSYCEEHGLARVNPVMLVIAEDTKAADEFRDILDSESFDNGAWIGKTLLVHSQLTGDDKEKALADLDDVESPDSPVRIIISVGMLKEGWDVKNVWVIASMRPSISEVLTEQTLGRGMRLPFGSYTDVPFLNSLEVLAHERYEDILKKRESLNEKFVDYAVWMEARTDADGNEVIVKEETESSTPAVFPTGGEEGSTGSGSTPEGTGTISCFGGQTTGSGIGIGSLEDVTEAARRQANEAAEKRARTHEVIPNRVAIVLPYVDQVPTRADVSLNQITDLDRFTALGRAIGVNADEDLKRVRLTSVDGKVDGVVDDSYQVRAGRLDLPIEVTRDGLINAILNTPGVPRRPNELNAAKKIADSVIRGMGDQAPVILSAFTDSTMRRTSRLVQELLTSSATGVSYSDEVRLTPLTKPRVFKKKHVPSSVESFDRSCAYEGWKKCLYPASTFDSRPEFRVAKTVDNTDDVLVWSRLAINDLPITWTISGRRYNPDFAVIERGDDQDRGWIVEVKSDKDSQSDEVLAKKKAAKTWANIVNNAEATDVEWSYLLLTESDIEAAHESWERMKSLGS
ncbi:DEAD/DEAH box helicase family protein [Gordonia alkaliphila]|uniref:DEAD/DEAH box helicase family protein n=1 Tax=Gordonia alkaliphila TaxID=1053547 RepID=UPI001FF47349|nr:DEAD/DEAH box helicase family protein [Gordonia alkaliphila]MCK0440261.1 DEAD/DEAH box helicase family protein [Gordonia alkaliphila]